MVTQDFIDAEQSTQRRPAELIHLYNGVDDLFIANGDVSVLYDGDTYVPATVKRGNLKYTSDMSVSQLDISILFDESMVDDYLHQAVVDTLWVKIMKIHRDMSPLEAYTTFLGRVTSASFKGSLASLKTVSLKQYFDILIPKFRYQSICNHALYSTECGILPASYSWSGIVATLSDDGLIFTSTAIKTAMEGAGKSTNEYCKMGYVSYGNYTRYITKQNGEYFYLRYKHPTLAVGTTVTVYAGCDGLATTCRDKFDNISQFLGFTEIPWLNPVTTLL